MRNGSSSVKNSISMNALRKTLMRSSNVLKCLLLAALCTFATFLAVAILSFWIWAIVIGVDRMQGSPGNGVGALALTIILGLIAATIAFPIFFGRFYAGKRPDRQHSIGSGMK